MPDNNMPPAADMIVAAAGSKDNFDRCEGESAQAYEAARAYFDLRADRSLVEVCKKLGKRKSLISRWSTRWNWVERANAWDRFVDAAVRKGVAEAAARVAQKWEERENAMRERAYAQSLTGLERVDKMFAYPLASVTTDSLTEGPNGPIIRRTTVKPPKWTFDTAHRLARAMWEQNRRALRNECGSRGGGPEEESEEVWIDESYGNGPIQ